MRLYKRFLSSAFSASPKNYTWEVSMRSAYRPANLGAFLALVVTSLSAFPAQGQQTRASTQHLRFVHHDVSPQLRDMPPIPPREERRVIPHPSSFAPSRPEFDRRRLRRLRLHGRRPAAEDNRLFRAHAIRPVVEPAICIRRRGADSVAVGSLADAEKIQPAGCRDKRAD